MTAPLTPALALAYLRELSVDVRAAVVLDRAGAVLAGEEALAPRVRALLAATAASPTAAGDLLVARTSDGGAIAAIAGEFALLPVLEHDLRAAAAALATTAPDVPAG
jgi:hypothetical protein